MCNQNQQPSKAQQAAPPSPVGQEAIPSKPASTSPAVQHGAGRRVRPGAKKRLRRLRWRRRKNPLLQIGILFSMIAGLAFALWNLSTGTRAFLRILAGYVGIHLPDTPMNAQNSFIYLLMTVFLANSFSQILLDFYTGKNKGYLSAVCRLIPTALGLVGFLKLLR